MHYKNKQHSDSYLLLNSGTSSSVTSCFILIVHNTANCSKLFLSSNSGSRFLAHCEQILRINPHCDATWTSERSTWCLQAHALRRCIKCIWDDKLPLSTVWRLNVLERKREQWGKTNITLFFAFVNKFHISLLGWK